MLTQIRMILRGFFFLLFTRSYDSEAISREAWLYSWFRTEAMKVFFPHPNFFAIARHFLADSIGNYRIAAGFEIGVVEL